jgi:predicted outer membrane protein
MQPQQPYSQPPAAPQNVGQYDFITGGGSQTSKFKGLKNTPKTLLVVAVGALLLIGLVWIILGLAFGGGNNKVAPLVGIAQQQAELIRISSTATQDDSLSGQDAKNFAQTTQLSLSTDQQATVAFLAKNGKKIDKKQLVLMKSSQTDTALTAAKASGNYDTTYVSIMQTQLKAYQASLKQAYSGATNKTEQQLLNNAFNNSTLLLELSSQHN